MNAEEKLKEIKEIVKARLASVPSTAKLSIGSRGTFTRDQLLKEIEENSEIGKKMIEIQLKSIQMLKTGALYANIKK